MNFANIFYTATQNSKVNIYIYMIKNGIELIVLYDLMNIIYTNRFSKCFLKIFLKFYLKQNEFQATYNHI